MQKQLHPGAKWLFRIRAYSVLIVLAIILGSFIIQMFSILLKAGNEEGVSGAIAALIVTLIVYILIIILVGEIYTRMSYNRWFYDFTDTNLKVERGIIWKKYSNIPYDRVQNVDIQRGILARLFGFSSVMIQTAGFSYTPNRGSWAEGYIPAVDMNEAEKIRDFLMKKIGKKSKGGL
jgi:membrane protein YdbS with pleckstrin-like domain